MSDKTAPASFVDLLHRAVSDPGLISAAYHSFHGYSLGNQLLALAQCLDRGIAPGPIATFPTWKAKGRYVRKGEHAIVLCMPITCKRKKAEVLEEAVPGDRDGAYTRFVYRPNWFVLAQTEGQDVEAPTLPDWDQMRALDALSILEEPFSMLDGNCQGYARKRAIAISPIAELPHKTRFHELAHVVLGHTSEGDGEMADSELTPRSLREVEAEAVALLCLEALHLPGAEYCRGYIQSWNAHRGSEPISERSAQRILKAADAILTAGRAPAEAQS